MMRQVRESRSRSHAARVRFQRAVVEQEPVPELLPNDDELPNPFIGLGHHFGLFPGIEEIFGAIHVVEEDEPEQRPRPRTVQETKEEMAALSRQITSNEIAFPAPKGKECMVHFARDVYLFSSISDPDYKGYLQGDGDLFNWDFFMAKELSKECENGFFTLRITDDRKGAMNISMFQQAEVLLQFYHVDGDEDETKSITLVHEEPTHRISLEPFPSSVQIKAHYMEFKSIIPAKMLNDGVAQISNLNLILLRLHVKLMKGEVNVLHGIQKCFHPNKALYDLRERMENLLVEGQNADVAIISKDDKRYKAHRSILAANCDFYKNLFASGMKETKESRVPFAFGGKALEAFLKFVYGRNRLDLEVNPSLTMEVYRAADMYNVQLLKEVCEESLLAMPMQRFSLDRLLLLFYYGTTMGSLALQAHAVHLIVALGGEISGSKMFLKIAQSDGEIVGKLLEKITEFKKEILEA